MLVICTGCNQEFDCPKKHFNFAIKRNRNLFCSKNCFYIHKSKLHSVTTNCANCGKEIKKQNSALSRSKTGNLYCSKSCSVSSNNAIFRKWENHPSFKSGIGSYRNLIFSSTENPKCKDCGYDNLLALEVHHKDRDRTNNELDNLQILCCNCHTIRHKLKL